MEQAELDARRETLLTLKADIEQLNNDGREAAGTVTLDQAKVGRLSRMEAMQAQQMAQETARRRQLQLHKIASALNRLDTGDYGFCLACGEAINPARLDFDPACTRCINCADG